MRDTIQQLPVYKILMDCFILGLGIFSIKFLAYLEPYKRGFFCDDESLMYPQLSDTVTSNTLHIYCILLNVILITLFEYLGTSSSNKKGYIKFWIVTIPDWLVNVYSHVGMFLVGYTCTCLFTDVGKYIIGRHRPFFFQMCNSSIDCTLPENRDRYILPTEFTCETEDKSGLIHSMKSFPSGHSSLSMFSMLYLSLYLNRRASFNCSYLLCYTLQFICMTLAWVTALTRVSDYKHHWSDVTAGIIIGGIFALLFFFLGTNLKNEPKRCISILPRKREETLPTNNINTIT